MYDFKCRFPFRKKRIKKEFNLMGRKYQMTVISLYLSQKSTSTLESLAFGEEGYIFRLRRFVLQYL